MKQPTLVKLSAKKSTNQKSNELLNQIRKNLENISTGHSKFEFEAFVLEAYPTPARQLVAVMKRIEEIYSTIESMSTLSTLENDHNYRTLTELQNELKILSDWYNERPNKEEILKRFDAEEPEYWAYVLGRMAAIEVLSLGKTSKETMNKMSHLPEKQYETAVQTCVRYTTLISSITENVEQLMLGSLNNVPKT